MVMRKGGWKPAALTQKDIHAIVAFSVACAIVRGVDYITGDMAPLRQTAIAEIVMPLWGWAVALWVGCALVLLGWWQRRHAFVFAGHLILAVLYSSLGLGLLGSYVQDFLEDGVKGYVFDGVRNVGPLLTIALLHGFLTARTGTHPLERSDMSVDEAVVRKATTDE